MPLQTNKFHYCFSICQSLERSNLQVSMWRLWQLWLLLGTLQLMLWNSYALLGGEKRTIERCLVNFGGLTMETAQRLERFTQWSDTYEEIPCFTSCYLSEMFNFYHETAGFHEQRIIERFGKPIYDACMTRLQLPEGQNSSCAHAYSGFHCIVSLENDPFILIEKLPNITTSARSAMKECLLQVDQVEWSRIGDYQNFPVREPIPCFTRCFIGKLQLFNERTRRWQLDAMHKALNVPQPNAKTGSCHIRRGRNPCMSIYNQFTCYVMAE